MDEDDNISNADISMDDDDEDESTSQQPEHATTTTATATATTTTAAAAAATRRAAQRRNRSRERAEDNASSDVELPTYALQFQLANVAGGSSTAPAPAAAAAATTTTTTAATAGGSSPFHDWDSQTAATRSSSGQANAAGQEEANSDASATAAAAAAAAAGAKPSFFFGTSSFILRSRKEVAALINTECCRGGPTPDLDSIMDTLFNSGTPIDNPDNIEWIRWLIAGGRTPKEFVKIVRSYDNHAKCGLVWVPHVVAYRCRTCGISPCMSICRDCFKKGNHTNHDFNMFLSQAGGACDCGDTSVMKAEGFCSDHGINNRVNRDPVPNNLLAVAEAIMPKLLFRLLQHFREHSDASLQAHAVTSYSCEAFANMLIDLNNMGEIMRKVMTRTLINADVYSFFMDIPYQDTRNGRFLRANREKYEDAVNRFPNPEPPEEYRDLPALGNKLVHTTLLEEFIFWTFKFEFPQTLVCFLLNMLPDQDYKEHLTRTFVMHYSRIPSVLEMSRDPDTLSNRVVHMSVQLFSNESLALKMVNELSLLHVMIISLKLMMSKILIQNTLHDPTKNFHFVIDCTRQVMKDHCYWPLVSDFNNVLSHESVALVFLRDDNLIDMWFQFLQMLQGMNVNVRETASHVEFEPNSYYAAFSCELEASAYPMWSIISHLQDGTHAHLAKKIINYCVTTLHEWLDSIYFREPKLSLEEMMQASFHFPLHRYLAAFVCQAVTKMGISLNEVLPSRPDILPLLMIHPLRVQVSWRLLSL
ncbi:hypothetical protein KR222_001911 [Zaprionus bogoriensis]|nr:hypothetical protein KR222_001911 [Zaprionus bogoriensis]